MKIGEGRAGVEGIPLLGLRNERIRDQQRVRRPRVDEADEGEEGAAAGGACC